MNAAALSGNADAVAGAGDQAAAAGGRFRLAGTTLAAGGAAVTTRWKGRSADAARAGLLRLATRSDVGADVAGRAAAVLRGYATQLRVAEAHAQRASFDLDQARQFRPELAHISPRTFDDPRPLVSEAQRAFDMARVEAVRANDDAARRIDQLLADLSAMGEPSSTECEVLPFEPTIDAPPRSSRIGHAILQTLGLIPVLGEPADLVDALGYTLEGDNASAAMSAAAAVPIFGSGARAVSLVKKADEAVEVTAAARTARTVDAAEKIPHVPPAPISRQKQDSHKFENPQFKNRRRQGKRTSYWSDSAEADRLTQEAWQRGTWLPDQSKVKEYNFGRQVGVGPEGQVQVRVRVHVDGKGAIHGYPAGPHTP